MIIDIITIFPEMLTPLNYSMIGKAQEKGLITIRVHNYRDFSIHSNGHVDDTPYGGGSGMIAEAEPVINCLKSIEGYEKAYKIITLPEGTPFSQKKAHELSQNDHLIIVCGHYEGIDYRVNNYMDEAISIGDYILTGGEMAALVITDSVSRLVKDVLGNSESIVEESFNNDLLEYDQYTKPEHYNGLDVPSVLLSGDHEKIRIWRKKNSIKKTKEKRPDLYQKWLNSPLSNEDKECALEVELEEASIVKYEKES